MKKKRNTGRKKIDIYQKSFSFTHRYNKEKFAFERLKSLKSNFALKINNRLILSAIVFSSLFLAVTIKMIEINLLYTEKGNYFVENVKTKRGNILDRNNTSLTANLLTSHISVNPKAVYDKKKFISKVSAINNRFSATDLDKLVSEKKFFWLDRNVEPLELQKYIDLGETGIEFRDAYKRKYMSENKSSIPLTSDSNVLLIGLFIFFLFRRFFFRFLFFIPIIGSLIFFLIILKGNFKNLHKSSV